MAKTRSQNRVSNTSKVYEVELLGKWLLFISWVLGQIQGLDKEQSGFVGNIIEELGFENPEMRIKPTEVYVHNLSGYELKFLKGQIDQLWSEKKVQPMHASSSIAFYEYITELMNTPGPDSQEE